MWQQLTFENKVKFLSQKIDGCEKSIDMYCKHIEAYRGKNDVYSVTYVRGCKERMKAHKSDLLYYKSELEKAKRQYEIAIIFQ